MANAKVLKLISIILLALMVTVTGSEATEAAIRHMDGKTGFVRTIVPGNRLKDLMDNKTVPEENVKILNESDADKEKKQNPETDRDFTSEEMDLFAGLVHAEAKGEPYRGKVAVAAAILNRIDSSVYPDDLKSVVFQVDSGYYQFCPVRDGSIWQTPDETAYRAVEEAIEGKDPSKGAISFYNPATSSNRWVRQQTVTTTIGNHVFFKLAR